MRRCDTDMPRGLVEVLSYLARQGETVEWRVAQWLARELGWKASRDDYMLVYQTLKLVCAR